MKSVDEKYIHLQVCVDDLNEALLILEALDAIESGVIKGAAFRYALIAYSRPYKTSRGKCGRLSLGPDHIPKEYIPLHQRILDARDQIHAHTDLLVLDAKLQIHHLDDVNLPLITSNLIDSLAELQNVVDIKLMIKKTLDSLILFIEKYQATL